MRILTVAAVLAAAAATATPALAGTGQCYDRFNRPVGATYDTDHPNNAFLQWVQRNGGRCDRVGNNPGFVRQYPQGSPYATQRPDFYDRPYRPSNIDQFGEVGHVTRLITRYHRRMGHQNAYVADTGRHIAIDNRGYKVFSVQWWPQGYEYIAVRQRREGGYVARVFRAGQGWVGPVDLGY